MADDPMMEVPLAQRNLQRNLNIMAMQASQGSLQHNPSPDAMMMDEDDTSGRIDDTERRDSDEGRDSPEGNYTPTRPWYMPTFWQPSPPALRPVSSSPTSSNDCFDCREEDISMERECTEETDYNARIHEPLKRQQDNGMQANKRRRVGEAASMAFYNSIPSFTEQQQAIVEYSAPAAFTPLFYFLGYTPFAVTWVAVMYIGHFVQTALSTFGPETENLRWKAWIPPLVHHLMDTYIWNHSMITLMLLYPELFGDTAYWLGVFFTMGQQHMYLVASLKTHYVKRQEFILHQDRRSMELRLVDCFLLYGLAAFTFTLSRLFSIRYLLWIGLVEFNMAPLYLVWAHKKRMEEAMARKKATEPATKKEEPKKETKKDK